MSVTDGWLAPEAYRYKKERGGRVKTLQMVGERVGGREGERVSVTDGWPRRSIEERGGRANIAFVRNSKF